MKLLLLLLLMEGAVSQQRGLFPAILNLASNAVISSNATCGDPGPEVYCKLVEHVPGRQIKNPHCLRCDANSVLSKERHPITNAIDGTNYWWQSPSIKNGHQFHWVTITLDLKQIFQVAYIIIKAANSPRPGNWILERSLDGVTFDPWQFHALSDSECLSRYNMTPRLGPPTYKSDTEVICTSYYSRLNPLEHGEIHTSLINSRPGADDLTSELLNFTSARYIRLRLQRIRTLNADLMMLSARDPREIDPIVTRRYYYSIKDISVGGMCICYGHAQSCPLDLDTKKLKCVCEHNTCGESCDQCCPGYHQQPWQPGTVSEGNTCEKCNCHNKTENCFYNQTVSELFLSTNTHGVHEGGGVCLDCQQNTAGINCETCAAGFYRPTEVSPYSDLPCVRCNCDLRGSESSVCSSDDTHTGVSAGQCVCQQGFTGRRCDRCAFGYRDFPQCTRCECNLSGSINTDPCSKCTCKVNVMGAHCDLCKPGFYNLQESNQLGCTDCFCFGVSDVCESSTWSRAQVFLANAWLRPSHSLHPPPVIYSNDLPIPKNASGYAHQQVLSWTAPDSFLGNKLLSYRGSLNYSLVYDVPLDNEDHSLPVHSDIIIEGNGRALCLSPPAVLFLSELAERSVAVTMAEQKFVDVQSGSHVARDDLLSVMAHVTSLTIRVHLNASTEGPVRLSSVSLDFADSGSVSGLQAVAVETCECPYGYSGTSCESCLPGFYRVGGVLFGGNCMQCECNDHAYDCDTDGVCLGCTHNTTGPQCDRCLPGFYGDATEGTPGDCRLCPCPLTEPSNSFSPTCSLDASGQVSCDRCRDGYTGRTCERCASGFHGNPQAVGGTCVRCECNGNVDLGEAGHCDTVTGECLRCLGNTGGRHCEVCQPGYHGDAVRAKDCRECGCHVSGALSSVCDVTTGRCFCRENVTGLTCDRCQSGFFGLQSPEGCRVCGCNQSGSLSESCDENGRCQCVEGVSGDTCDRCSPGHYGFHADGCKACSCDHTGGNCDPEDGTCICPPHTVGDTCDRCAAGYWGHDPTTGCKACSCTGAGSSAPQCQLTNGQCLCKEGFSGRSCDRCALGYHGYPACRACGCDLAGSNEDFCNATLGVCDCQHAGKCVCKVGVSGRRCEECVSGWFALSAESPDGCSPCFCSGVGSDCEEQAGLQRVPISPDPSPALLSLVSQSNLQGVVSGVHQQGGDSLLDTRHLDSSRPTGPLYWRLPPQYQGQQLLSYGGLLSYAVTFHAEDGLGLSNQEPQVLMRGGTMRKHVIYADMVAPGNGIWTQHNIRMTEHKWKYFNSVSEQPVSRDDFMSVLSDVEYVIIKASYGTRLQQSRISNITMETAVEAELDEGNVAGLIESCVCPPGYSGLSCQECAFGFFRQPLSELPTKKQKSLFVRPCVPCRCNNHSESCDAESGACLDCQHHTTGRSCSLCAPGHYGNISGSISDCSLCACPLPDNSFSSTCVSEGGAGGFRCTACQKGYEGRHCERCSLGYYGNPVEAGGVCAPCGCSGWGSLRPLCDALSGQCECKAGVKGQACDRCGERHVLQGGECVSCDDECVGVLLDDLEEVHAHFLSVNLSAISTAPYGQLLLLANRSRDVQVQLSGNSSAALHLFTVEDELDHLSADIDALLQQLPRLSINLEKVDVSVNSSLSQGAMLLETISSLQHHIHELQREAGLLHQTGATELDPAKRTHLLEEVESMMETIRAVDLKGHNASANQELRLAESLVRSLQDDFLSRTAAADARLRLLSVPLEVATETLQLAQTRLSNAELQNRLTHTLLETAQPLLHRYKSLHHNLSVEVVSVDGVMEDSQLLLDDVISLTEEFTNSSQQVEAFSGQLDQWRPLLRKQVDALVIGLKMTDALEIVYRAEGHALLLQSHAHSLHSSMASVCNVSQNSSQLVKLDSDVTEQVDSVQQVALMAESSASLALNMTVQSGKLVSEEGVAKLTASSSALAESRRINETAEELQLKVSTVTGRLGLVRDGLYNCSLLLRQPIRGLQRLPNASSATLLQARRQAAAARSGLQEALQRLHRLGLRLQNSSSMVENTNASVRETNRMVAQTHSTANEAQRQLEEAEQRTVRLMERIKPLSMLGETLSRNLSDIRELIDQARRQAASIKVAVQANRDCVRSYRPQIQSSNFNTVSLTLKTSSRDNLLFYLGSNATVDFLAVEMHAGKVSLVWDAGSGRTRLEFPGLDVANNRWTRINVTRFGARASLSVHQLESAMSPLPAVTATSPGPSRVLDINRNTVIHIGGLGSHTQSPAALRSSTFQGCVGEASLNERNIGLWSYDSREGACGGCFSSPQAEETSFHFDGSGFSLVQKSLRATSTSIVLLFKTLSPGGLLLYLASNNTRDFLSMELVEGRVRLTFELGSGALILTSKRKYNTGVWYKITLQRSKRKGYLSIMAADQSSDKEVLEAESPGTASDLNRSDMDPIYVGGLPASRPIRRQVVSRSYVGCIKNVEIARSNFDLLRDAFGVRKGCVLEAVRSVSLFGGFVQIAPPSLGQEAELLFSFSTGNQSGVLLAAFSDKLAQRQHFLSVHLVSGSLEAQLGEVGGATRKVMVVKPDGGSFSDRTKHSVIVTIHRKSLSVQVDEEYWKSVSGSPGELSRSPPASFFIGGLPSGEESRLPIRLQGVSRSFRGCIQDLAVGGSLVDLSRAVRYEGAELDSCLLEEKVVGPVLPDDQDVDPTSDPAHLPAAPTSHMSAMAPGALTCVSEAEPTFLPSAAQFGLSKHSHMTFIIAPHTVKRNVLVRLSVRSRARDGLVLLLSDSKQMDFVALKLSGGRLMMSADLGKGSASITSSVAVDDGEWHTVVGEVGRRSVSVSVDGSGPDHVSLKGNQLDVDARLYLGGLPSTHSTRRINVSSSFPGCVRSASLNGATLNLSEPASRHDVSSCFTSDQTGSFFNGSGYAALMRDGYKVGSDLLVSLEFRTSKPEGVLLGISSAKVDAIGLEMINGQVVFNVNNGAGRVSVRSVGHKLCDGKWHRLLARKTKHSVSLSVDGQSRTTSNPYPQSTSAETKDAVYLGGFPVGVKQNCLSISSRFTGCLMNLKLVKSHQSEVLDLSSAHFLLGVTPNSCPIAKPHPASL